MPAIEAATAAMTIASGIIASELTLFKGGQACYNRFTASSTHFDEADKEIRVVCDYLYEYHLFYMDNEFNDALVHFRDLVEGRSRLRQRYEAFSIFAKLISRAPKEAAEEFVRQAKTKNGFVQAISSSARQRLQLALESDPRSVILEDAAAQRKQRIQNLEAYFKPKMTGSQAGIESTIASVQDAAKTIDGKIVAPADQTSGSPKAITGSSARPTIAKISKAIPAVPIISSNESHEMQRFQLRKT